MKKLVFIPLILLIVSCSVKEKPLFVKVDNIEVINATLDIIELEADAYFINKNDVGGTLESKGIEVFVNDVSIAHVSSESFKVPAREEFSIPLKVVIPTKEVLEKNKNGLLGGILSSILDQKMKIQYKGTITYSTLGFSYDYEIDRTEDVKIKM
ncbi:LEA type 2 family protein [uncultured Kordia sp.]|uniref:LEA type 2 family protein n=1 Tax=uncultured Kordia sp. TaxID=507699 RepID=UPI002624E65C|nr:LEA type 2 family protein [uncultured Kordia sp.]